MRLTWFRRNSKQQVVKASGLQKKWSPFYFDNKPGKYLLVPGLAASLIKFRSLLQQYSQEQFNATPSYLLLDEKGPDHNKCFGDRGQVLILPAILLYCDVLKPLDFTKSPTY